MYDDYQSWALKTYGDSAKTKTVTRKKYDRVVKILRGEESSNVENNKFRLWVKAKGFKIGPIKPEDIGKYGYKAEDEILYVPVTKPAANSSTSSKSAATSTNSSASTTIKAEDDELIYKRVAVVENFFEIIYNVHVEMDGRSGKHAGQKRTYRAVAEMYAFLPREAVTRFLMSCSDCQKRMHLQGINTNNSATGNGASAMNIINGPVKKSLLSKKENQTDKCTKRGRSNQKVVIENFDDQQQSEDYFLPLTTSYLKKKRSSNDNFNLELSKTLINDESIFKYEPESFEEWGIVSILNENENDSQYIEDNNDNDQINMNITFNSTNRNSNNNNNNNTNSINNSNSLINGNINSNDKEIDKCSTNVNNKSLKSSGKVTNRKRKHSPCKNQNNLKIKLTRNQINLNENLNDQEKYLCKLNEEKDENVIDEHNSNKEKREAADNEDTFDEQDDEEDDLYCNDDLDEEMNDHIDISTGKEEEKILSNKDNRIMVRRSISSSSSSLKKGTLLSSGKEEATTSSSAATKTTTSASNPIDMSKSKNDINTNYIDGNDDHININGVGNKRCNNIISQGDHQKKLKSSVNTLKRKQTLTLIQDDHCKDNLLDEEDDEDEEENDTICNEKIDQIYFDPERLKAFNMFVRLFVDENLDRMVPISRQPKDKIQAIMESCSRQFPEFSDRSRKRIRTYLKSCRRNRRYKTNGTSESTRSTTTYHLTSAMAEQILSNACENEYQNAKRIRAGLQPLPANVASSMSDIDLVNFPNSYSGSSVSAVQILKTNTNSNLFQNISKIEETLSEVKSNCNIASTSNSSLLPSLASSSTAAALTAASGASLTSATRSYSPASSSPTASISASLNNTNNLNLSNLIQRSLNPTETASIKQLITGYRESAAFLLRCADQLENLLLQQN